MRIDAILGQFGYCSRREAPGWVKAGRVTVRGVVARSASAKADPEEVLVDGVGVPFIRGIYAAMNKPLGYVCSHREEGKLVDDLLPAQWRRRAKAVNTVGRLDKETSGLLLLTDDGAFLHAMTSPRRHVPKVYEFEVSSPVPPEAVELFARGGLCLRGEDSPCLPAELSLTGPCSGRLSLHEGRYHQVRRMLAAVGTPVIRLERVGIGPLTLEGLGLAPGEWKPIDPAWLA